MKTSSFCKFRESSPKDLLPNNPICNPFENLWSFMKAKVEALCPQTKEDYKNSLMANDNGSFFHR